MMSRIPRRISKIGLLLGDLVASATGCFVFTRGFRLVVMVEEVAEATLPMRQNDRPPN